MKGKKFDIYIFVGGNDDDLVAIKKGVIFMEDNFPGEEHKSESEPG